MKLTAEQVAHEAEVKLGNAVDKVEQQLRDALFSRTTVHIGEQRILKAAFTKFDKDASGEVDIHEFIKALEYIGLHTAEHGLPGEGGNPRDVVEALFRRYDLDGSGTIDYDEFCNAILKEQSEMQHKLY